MVVQARVEAEGLETEVVKGARAGPTEQEATRSGLSGLPEQSGLWSGLCGFLDWSGLWSRLWWPARAHQQDRDRWS